MEAWGLGLGSDGLQRVFLSACLQNGQGNYNLHEGGGG